jgi:hypothetical protein
MFKHIAYWWNIDQTYRQYQIEKIYF